MTVSGKMIEAVDKLEDVCGTYISRDKQTMGERLGCIDNTEKVAQAVINAAWTRFDPEDESTRPESEYAPSGHEWLLVEVDKQDNFETFVVSWSKRSNTFFNPEFTFTQKNFKDNTYRYADPRDLMFKTS